MTKNRILLLSVVFGLISVIWRLVPHTENISPVLSLVTVLGLCSAAAWWVPLVILTPLVLVDVWTGFHPVLWSVYFCYFIFYFWTKVVSSKDSFSFNQGVKFVGLNTFQVLFFFIVTNFAHWILTSMYDKSWVGLLQCYAMALPFLKAQTLGTLIFSSLAFFGVALQSEHMRVKISESVKR